MTGEEGWSNPQIVVNGASIGAMERGAAPNRRSLRVSRGEKRGNPHPIPRVTAQRATLREVNSGEGRGETQRWSQIAAQRGSLKANRNEG